MVESNAVGCPQSELVKIKVELHTRAPVDLCQYAAKQPTGPESKRKWRRTVALWHDCSPLQRPLRALQLARTVGAEKASDEGIDAVERKVRKGPAGQGRTHRHARIRSGRFARFGGSALDLDSRRLPHPGDFLPLGAEFAARPRRFDRARNG